MILIELSTDQTVPLYSFFFPQVTNIVKMRWVVACTLLINSRH